MTNPVAEPEGRREFTGRIVPVYPLTAGVSQLLLSRAIRQGLDECADILPDCLPDSVRQFLQENGLTERHARALLRLGTEEQQLSAAQVFCRRRMNVAAAEAYIEDLLHRQQVTPPKGRTTYIIKDVRLFLNSVDRGLHLMRQAGVNADWGRQDTDEEILLTIRIPKRVRT